MVEIFDKLKSMVGVGQPTIAIRGVEAPLRAGAAVRGTVVLTGGEYDAALEDVQVRLDQQKLVYTAPGRPERQFWQRVGEVVLPMSGRVLRPGEVVEVAFELALPAVVEPSSASVGYELVADTEVPGLNPRAAVEVAVEA